MRSRYSAFALGDAAYLEASWHPDFLPANFAIDESTRWLGLELIAAEQKNDRARVEFEARFLLDGRVDAIHENSRFVCQQGRWLYTDGDMLAPTFTAWKPGRNESCPCGSGKKYKHCHLGKEIGMTKSQSRLLVLAALAAIGGGSWGVAYYFGFRAGGLTALALVIALGIYLVVRKPPPASGRGGAARIDFGA